MAIDQAIGALLLETVAPAAIEVALAVQKEIAQRVEQAGDLRQAQLQRARYEAELARRRYAKVDPDNRLVADALEAEWNDRLRQFDALQRDDERQQQGDQSLIDEPARKRILELARDFPRVWNDPRTSAVERKRMLGLLIEDVTLVGGPQTTVNVRWRGGRTQTLFVDRPVPIARIRRTLPEVVQLIDELFETLSDPEVVKRLNELNHRNWLGEPFTIKKVTHVRIVYGLKSRAQRLRERGMLTAKEVASQLGISTTTVHQFVRTGLLKRHLYGNRRCLYEPPGDVKLIKGVPSRAGSRPPRLIAVQPSERGAI